MIILLPSHRKSLFSSILAVSAYDRNTNYTFLTYFFSCPRCDRISFLFTSVLLKLSLVVALKLV